MDYTIRNHEKLFDELLAVLNRHAGEPGVGEVIADLNAARLNYRNRSIDHMLSCLVLTIHGLSASSTSNALRDDLRAVLDKFVKDILQTGSKLRALAREYEESGGKLLSREEILQEVEERRGVSR